MVVRESDPTNPFLTPRDSLNISYDPDADMHLQLYEESYDIKWGTPGKEEQIPIIMDQEFMWNLPVRCAGFKITDPMGELSNIIQIRRSRKISDTAICPFPKWHYDQKILESTDLHGRCRKCQQDKCNCTQFNIHPVERHLPVDPANLVADMNPESEGLWMDSKELSPCEDWYNTDDEEYIFSGRDDKMLKIPYVPSPLTMTGVHTMTGFKKLPLGTGPVRRSKKERKALAEEARGTYSSEDEAMPGESDFQPPSVWPD